ncbi:MAG TPA: prepilin-type N-terminal cleavage/methylation domain-containing protein [Bryobacteraceae bacterium]|jgi:prepilin-type N-terminal cleavage/methylation domain-containing protein|nr:prepilin-type N-terminal cleavage/methylation domain-containing protein [Bryobacteraceae bacterium]
MNHIRKRRGFSLIELLIVIAIILIIATIALPKLNRARMYAQETASIAAIKTIHSAQTQYFSQFGRFATNLTELGPPSSGQPGPSGADLIPGDLANGEKSGYKFVVASGPGGYTISAVPLVYNTSGTRTFFSDQSLVIRENYGQEPATVASKEIK